jgi:hypothetical protein
MFKFILIGEEKDFIMCASTFAAPGCSDKDELDGIHYGHAYSLLAAYEVMIDGKM